MQSLLDDLCDFNRTQLGLGINIAPHDVDLKPVLADVVDELRAANPGRQIALEIDGDRSERQRQQQERFGIGPVHRQRNRQSPSRRDPR